LLLHCYSKDLKTVHYYLGRSQWPRSLRRGSAAASSAEIVGSNATGGMDVCLLWLLCVVR